MEADSSADLQARVRDAIAGDIKLCIRGSGSKTFYGREPKGQLLDVSQHHGVINYQPSELVLTARAGTRLAAIETLLAEHNQMLPFEPPAAIQFPSGVSATQCMSAGKVCENRTNPGTDASNRVICPRSCPATARF